MDKYNDLEICILSCFLQKPKLISKTRLDDKHFIKHRKIWQFMKAYYKKYGDFDLTLMMAISKNKYRMMEYIIWLIDKEPSISKFKEYEQQLLDEYKESQKNKYLIEKIYELANNLYVRSITINDFNKNLSELYKNANELFKEVKK